MVTLTVLKVFFAGCRDVNDERSAFREVAEEQDRRVAVNLGFKLQPCGCEDTMPGCGRPQQLIDEDVDECNLFVLSLYMRWGTPTGEFSVDMTGKALARAINKAQAEGRPISEREARDELIHAAVFDLAVQKRGLEATEERARELYEAALACLSGTPTAVAGMSCSSPPPPEIQAIGDYILANSTEEELIQAYQKAIGAGRLRSEILADLTFEERNNPDIVDQMYNDFLEGEKASIVVIDIDFGADSEIECSQADVKVTCPPDILALTETPIAVPTRQGEE